MKEKVKSRMQNKMQSNAKSKVTGMTRRLMSLFLVIGLILTGVAGCANAKSGSAATAGSTAEVGSMAENGSIAESSSMAESGSIAESQSTAEDDSTTEIILTDQAGREVTLSAPAEKLVSSYYISTAILIALGCEDKLKGIEMKADTRELYKLAAPQLLELPAVGSGKGINVEETAALEPDVVILPLKLSDSVASFEELGIPVLVVNPETLEDFEACVELLGKATGQTERSKELLTYYSEQMDKAQELTKNLDRPRVYLSSGADYLRTATSKMYQNDLIAMAGGENVSAELTDGYWQTVSPEQVLSWNPEYIFAVSYAEYALEDILSDKSLANVQAVQEKKVMTFPSQIEPWDYPTPSSVLGVLWLTSKLHPEVYSEEEYLKEAKGFYGRFFDISVDDQQLGE